MELNLIGKTALITGSSKGIGKAIAKELANAGVNVLINGKNYDEVESVVMEIQRKYPNTKPQNAAGDLLNAEQRQNLLGKFSRVDLLINNLGIYEMMKMSDVTNDILLKYIETNALVGHYLAQHYLPSMQKQNFGRIVFVASEEAVMPSGMMPQYSISKTMLLAIVKNFSMETVGLDVTVNTVMPGPTLTEKVIDIIDTMIKKELPFIEKEKIFMQQNLPQSQLQRFIRPEEIARLVSFMCSPDATAFRGSPIRMDGGMVPTIY
ncbi:oxidoreductase [Bacillus anthracis]|nr:oxidoreductase [Bacillus anthracis]